MHSILTGFSTSQPAGGDNRFGSFAPKIRNPCPGTGPPQVTLFAMKIVPPQVLKPELHEAFGSALQAAYIVCFAETQLRPSSESFPVCETNWIASPVAGLALWSSCPDTALATPRQEKNRKPRVRVSLGAHQLTRLELSSSVARNFISPQEALAGHRDGWPRTSCESIRTIWHHLWMKLHGNNRDQPDAAPTFSLRSHAHLLR
jgi:hypothetical protein